MITYKCVKSHIKNICKLENVSIEWRSFSDSCPFNGYAICPKSKIILNKRSEHLVSPEDLFSLFMHELSHIWCFKSNIYMVVHNWKPIKKMTIKEIKIFIKTNVRAEKYVDIQAENICKTIFPGIKYIKSYRGKVEKKQVKLLQDGNIKSLKNELLKRKNKL